MPNPSAAEGSVPAVSLQACASRMCTMYVYVYVYATVLVLSLGLDIGVRYKSIEAAAVIATAPGCTAE